MKTGLLLTLISLSTLYANPDSVIINYANNLQFKQAYHETDRLKLLFPNSPKYYFMELGTLFIEAQFFAHSGPVTTRKKQYNLKLNSLVEKSEKAIEKFKDITLSLKDRFYLAGIYGYAGRAHGEMDNLWSAFRIGLKGKRMFEDILKEQPQNMDALLGLGMFEYYADRMSGFTGWIASLLGFTGTRKTGLKMLKTAFTQSSLTKAEAAKMLISIYYGMENNPYQALPYLQWYIKTYPKNHIYKQIYCQLQMDLGHYEKIENIVSQKAISPVYKAQYAAAINNTEQLNKYAKTISAQRAFYWPAQHILTNYLVNRAAILQNSTLNITENINLPPNLINNLKLYQKDLAHIQPLFKVQVLFNKKESLKEVEAYLNTPQKWPNSGFILLQIHHLAGNYYLYKKQYVKAEKHFLTLTKHPTAEIGLKAQAVRNLIYIYSQTKPTTEQVNYVNEVIDRYNMERLAYSAMDLHNNL